MYAATVQPPRARDARSSVHGAPSAPPPAQLIPHLALLAPLSRTTIEAPSPDLLTEALAAESLDPDDVAMDGVAAVEARDPPCKREQRERDDDDDADQGFVMPRRTRSERTFPPPISVIGRGGRPWLTLRAHQENGRLVLREMRLPSQELLQPCREDGRFRLFMHPEAGGRCVVTGAGSHTAAQD